MPAIDDIYEKRAPSVGGYGSLVPFHGTTVFDEHSPGEARYISLRGGTATPDDVLDLISEVTSQLRARTHSGELFYSFHCQDFGFNASGMDSLAEDVHNPFELAEQLQGTLEERHGRELRMHRPCFTVLGGVEGGLFWLLLRGGKDYKGDERAEWDINYSVQSGVLIDSPVASWPSLEAIIGSDGGPISQPATLLETGSVKIDEQPLEEVYPLDQAGTGDADIIAARNPFGAGDVDADDDRITEAVDRTQFLTYRVRGGTIGFDKEAEFRVTGMSVFLPDGITMWGHPLVVCRPYCKAIPSD